MSYNYTLRYRTFDQLLDDVQVDFQNLSLQNMIEPQQLIKVAKRVTYDLGLRIMMTKEALLEVKKNKVRLPDDFFVLNYSLICDELTINEPVIQGTDIQEVKMIPQYRQTPGTINPCTDPTVNCNKCGTPCGGCGCQTKPSNCVTLPDGQSYCNNPKLQLDCKGDVYELVQVVKSQQRVYKRLWPLRIINNAQTIACDCPNLYVKSPQEAWIKDNFLYTNFETGNVYISYQGQLEDEQGNLLVPDHPEINEYYEYAIKQRILENLLMNDEPVTAKLQMVEARLRQARNYALTIVNTPNFAEMKEMWWTNRRAQYGKYYDMFKSYPWNQAFNTNVEGQMNRY
jgi:hypothetical protein